MCICIIYHTFIKFAIFVAILLLSAGNIPGGYQKFRLIRTVTDVEATASILTAVSVKADKKNGANDRIRQGGRSPTQSLNAVKATVP